ncbi:hypothetical protein KFE25_013481 [Diacronema lutheri]|uniref:TauD/TfdA-like domain-containing protein n=1 Tax=Diacronema lutheri TaxID=2081491 RepID=A0A8J6CI36_DIALT|nr:hypothetical protein KFE25_013481 [Diacronema lutheri]
MVSRMLSVRATSATGRRDALDVGFADGLVGQFHALWLHDNCPSRRGATNQKTHATADTPVGASIAAARAEDEGARVSVDWAGSAGARSVYDAAWLHQHAFRLPDEPPRALAHAPPSAREPLPRLAYRDVLSSDATLFAWVRHLAEEGVCILEGAPDSPDSVCTAAERIAPVQETIYGRAWAVVDSSAGAINVAYTSVALPLHMDLAYYESPPGLQLLHCRRFDEQVTGGESVLLDAFEAAMAFAAIAPSHFAALATIPATFVKEHFARERPVCMRYRRPHFALNGRKELTAVFWSPPFDGPLYAPPADVPVYYAANRSFDAFLNERVGERGWTLRLQPGEIITFNNRRILHGRNAFEANGGVRALQGCYVNIDDFSSRYATLRRAHGEASAVEGTRRPEMGLPMLGNQDHANGVAMPVKST